jgi:hypothetical protein
LTQEKKPKPLRTPKPHGGVIRASAIKVRKCAKSAAFPAPRKPGGIRLFKDFIKKKS